MALLGSDIRPSNEVIWKFDIPQHALVALPKGSQILCVQVQHGKPVFWAIVDPEAPKVGRVVRAIGTGHEVPHGMLRDVEYAGTFQVAGGMLMWHVFMGPEQEIPTGD